MPTTNQPLRTKLSYIVVFLFLVCFLWAGVQNGLHTSVREALTLSDLPFLPPSLDGPDQDFKGFPDFGHYIPLRTITTDELALDNRRLIFMGDIHGMKSSVDTLLSKLSYNSSRDLLLHLGDFIAKGPSSLQVLSQFADANITGVRGNHEQKVIEWRAWIEWVEGHPEGQSWLKKLERKYSQGFDAKHKHEVDGLKWPIPKKWKFMGDHYTIARLMTVSQFSYLKTLPLVIHLPSLHTHAVHGGILPFNPEYPPDAPEQPLSHVPDVSFQPSTPTRTTQERALLTDIEQNTVPWVSLNIRSVLDNGKVSRQVNEGTPWSELWTMIMEECHGYEHHDETAGGFTPERQDGLESANLRLSCLPINVVYGHAAARGLDIKRWSFGLDTGCVKGQQLTAMLISDMTIPFVGGQTREVPFGENGKAQIVSIPCSRS